MQACWIYSETGPLFLMGTYFPWNTLKKNYFYIYITSKYLSKSTMLHLFSALDTTYLKCHHQTNWAQLTEMNKAAAGAVSRVAGLIKYKYVYGLRTELPCLLFKQNMYTHCIIIQINIQEAYDEYFSFLFLSYDVKLMWLCFIFLIYSGTHWICACLEYTTHSITNMSAAVTWIYKTFHFKRSFQSLLCKSILFSIIWPCVDSVCCTQKRTKPFLSAGNRHPTRLFTPFLRSIIWALGVNLACLDRSRPG